MLKVRKSSLVVIMIVSLFILGGCGEVLEKFNDASENETKDIDNGVNGKNPEVLMPVQEYTGEEYTLRNGKETDKIANENREIIENAVKCFFDEEYNTEVIVHNIVGNVDGATVFVESVGEPHFYTYAIIPINKQEEEILVDQVWSQEGQIENAIMAGIYGMVMEKEFQHLTDLIEEVNQEYNLTGLNKEAIPVGADKFCNEYYFVAIRKTENFKGLLNKYMENPDRTKEEWNSLMDWDEIQPDEIRIAIDLYMTENGVEPNQEAFDYLINLIDNDERIPKGLYGISLHDNYIDKTTATGNKDNSLKRANPNDIIKE
ncbi:DUF1672 family protein [Gracilibacillus lacisalsi]|uniref:DUF1672 family protein n=1 Tax=Gracilibacillus lacisalsi TaxID=393087 RepID=UPI000378DE27|nr:DUF1672 family protein [Gracilibacillus lacisalsi]